jgi:hypothetical protein
MPDNLSISGHDDIKLNIDISGGGSSVLLESATPTTGGNKAGLLSAPDKNKVEYILTTTGIKNYTTADNCEIDMTDDGAIITRSVAISSNPTLIVNRLGSVGEIQSWQNSGVLKAHIDYEGTFSGKGLKNNDYGEYAHVHVTTEGTYITRNIGDGHPALIIQQQHGSSTGDTLSVQNGSTEQLTVDYSGVVTISNLAGTGTRLVTADSNGALSTITANVSSGTYTPTVTVGVGTATPSGFTYMQINDIVSVNGLIDCSGIVAGVNDLKVTLPVASSFTANEQLNGVVTGIDLKAASPNYVLGDTSGVAHVSVHAVGGTASVYVQFQYQVL